MCCRCMFGSTSSRMRLCAKFMFAKYFSRSCLLARLMCFLRCICLLRNVYNECMYETKWEHIRLLSVPPSLSPVTVTMVRTKCTVAKIQFRLAAAAVPPESEHNKNRVNLQCYAPATTTTTTWSKEKDVYAICRHFICLRWWCTHSKSTLARFVPNGLRFD